MPRKPCLDCGALSNEHRCPLHMPAWKATKEASRNRPSSHARGYDNNHRKLAKQAIKRDGRCLRCGTTDDLCGDHVDPARKGATDLTVEDYQTLCRSCNGSKGDKPNFI